MSLSGVLDGLVGAAILAAASSIAAIIRGFWESRAVRVSGTYVTRTSGSAWLGDRDPDDGALSRSLVMKQVGTRVRARERGPEENAEWNLSARLTSDGFVLGTYTHAKPKTGISRGAFYLEIDRQNPERYRGLWTGWHAMHKEISTGTYRWRRLSSSPWWSDLLPWWWPEHLEQSEIDAVEFPDD